MISILVILAGVITILVGSNCMFKGEIELSESKTITGPTAQIVSILIFILGVAIIAFAFIGLPIILNM